MMNTKKTQATLPKLNWKTTTCQVCGHPVDYLSKRRPKTCNNGDCQYKHHYKIDIKSWAIYQPTLFE